MTHIILSNRVPRISVKEAKARALVVMVIGAWSRGLVATSFCTSERWLKGTCTRVV